ncbi:SDR family NAD(P)-dependent oxidoreductase [Virgibacillus sp. NKC19-3]|uniref:SDR family NAD(P)-dependent oxidoreductase n=1 Tax=Virgibacillus saliphilus TaxID=2831674 RepID=UPI001C9B0327|nr:SDR family NAD(P)-dependent oxidoreductase [Virgibacillus sp. NKC19-3]MBY7142270.1 SDR family NAD(P)-dependent oxidoreductase [Virgibacillus sp. NKC19-3]
MKYTVITGASSGIGYATALAFAERGKNLILAARREDKLEELKGEIAGINQNLDVIVKPVDLSVTENVHAFYESLNKYELETWINNAGFGNFDAVEEQNLTKIESMLHLNIEALTILSSLFVRDYANVEGTQIINVSSAAGYIMISNLVTYSATKFYVSAFTEGLAQELKSKGSKMQAKVLVPAVTETEFEQRSLDLEEFQYEGQISKYHTAKDMAGFMLELYDSKNTVGFVNENTYEFNLKDPIFPFREG